MTELPFVAGQTALVVTVPEAEDVVGEFRREHDQSAAFGVPAHVTVLFPFLPAESIDAAVLAELRHLFGTVPPFDLSFERTGRFPDVLHLEPQPSEPFRELTSAVAARWPTHPPYGGQFADVVPHLTVAQSDDQSVLDDIERTVNARLPLAARVTAVRLLGFDARRWDGTADFALGRANLQLGNAPW